MEVSVHPKNIHDVLFMQMENSNLLVTIVLLVTFCQYSATSFLPKAMLGFMISLLKT